LPNYIKSCEARIVDALNGNSGKGRHSFVKILFKKMQVYQIPEGLAPQYQGSGYALAMRWLRIKP
jgi:hypothetical protein